MENFQHGAKNDDTYLEKCGSTTTTKTLKKWKQIFFFYTPFVIRTVKNTKHFNIFFTQKSMAVLTLRDTLILAIFENVKTSVYTNIHGF